MATWRTLGTILTIGGLTIGGVLAWVPAQAEMPRQVSLGGIGAGMHEQHPLALRCLGLALGADLLRGHGRQAVEGAAADEADELPARVYGFALAKEDDEELACAMRQAQARPEA